MPSASGRVVIDFVASFLCERETDRERKRQRERERVLVSWHRPASAHRGAPASDGSLALTHALPPPPPPQPTPVHCSSNVWDREQRGSSAHTKQQCWLSLRRGGNATESAAGETHTRREREREQTGTDCYSHRCWHARSAGEPGQRIGVCVCAQQLSQTHTHTHIPTYVYPGADTVAHGTR